MKRLKTYTLFIICVALGGALGSVARVHLFAILPSPLPWVPTLIVNVLGAFLIGFVLEHDGHVHHHIITFAAIGFCGGFTTLSHFSYQTVMLIEQGLHLQAFANIALSLIVTLIAVAAGVALAAKLPHLKRRRR